MGLQTKIQRDRYVARSIVNSFGGIIKYLNEELCGEPYTIKEVTTLPRTKFSKKLKFDGTLFKCVDDQDFGHKFVHESWLPDISGEATYHEELLPLYDPEQNYIRVSYTTS